MPTVYEIHLLPGDATLSLAKLRTALEDALAQFHLPQSAGSVRVNGTPSDDASINRLVVFVAAETQAPSPSAVQTVRDWLAVGVPVVPLVPHGAPFETVVPEALRKINALKPEADGSPPIATILRLAGITEHDRRIFISYKRSDSQPVADQLWVALSECGFDVFLDRCSIDKGVDFQVDLVQELGDKAMVILLETARVKESKWVMAEVNYVRKNKLGLLVLSWPDVVLNPKLQVPVLPQDHRFALEDDHFQGSDRTKPLEQPVVDRLVQEVEFAHAKAMARRRNDLIQTLQMELEDHALPYSWTGSWSLDVLTPTSGTIVHLEVSPRPAAWESLYDCDLKRGQKGHANAFLVNPASDLTPRRTQMVAWIVEDKTVATVRDTQVRDLVYRLAQL